MSESPSQSDAALPAARRDVQISPQLYLGQTVYVVKDPVSLNYFRLRPTEHYIFTQLDGRVTAEELAERVSRAFPDEPGNVERISQFVHTLKAAGLLYGRDASHNQMLRQIESQRRKRRRRMRTVSFLFFRLPLFDPDAGLDWLYRHTRFLMNGPMCWLAISLMLVSLVAVLVHFAHMDTSPAWAILSPVNLVLMLAAFLGVKVIHEFGHGLAAKHRGLEVHEMGLFFMVFLPIFYVEISDTWMVPRRRDRLWITAGGVFLEMIFAAIASWVWILTEPGLVNQIALNVMITASVTTVLFNLNPLLRYDGYYFLMDWMQIPNMRQKAQQYVAYLGKRYVLGMPGQRPGREAARRPVFMVTFTVCATLYRYLIVLMIIGLLWAALEPMGLEPIAVLLASAAVGTMVVLPLVKMLTFIWQVQARTWRRMAASVAAVTLVGGVVAAVMAIPLEKSVESPGVVLSEQRRTVYAPASARVTQVFVRSGQYVRAGEPILQLDAEDVRDTLAELRIERQQIALRRDMALRDGQVDRAMSLAMREREQERRITHLERRLDELTVRAPVSGYVHPDRRLETVTGARMQRGDEIGHVIGADPPTFVLVVPQRRIGELSPGMPVRVRLWAEPDRALEGELARIGGRLIQELPHQALAAGVGGEVDVLPHRRYTWTPAEPSVTVRVALAAAQADTPSAQATASLDHELYDGMTGRGRVLIHEEARLGSQLWHWTRQRLSLDWWL